MTARSIYIPKHGQIRTESPFSFDIPVRLLNQPNIKSTMTRGVFFDVTSKPMSYANQHEHLLRNTN